MSSTFKAPTFNGTGEVELFLEQFQQLADGNNSTKKETLLHRCSSLEGATQTYRRETTTQLIFYSLRMTKERLMKLKRDPQGSIFDLAGDIG